MKTLLIRADASARIGIGHVMRCLALAQAWHEWGGKALFLSCSDSDLVRQRIESEGFAFIPLERHHPDPVDLERTVQTFAQLATGDSAKPNWIVADGYHFDAAYQRQLKEAGASLLCVDDYGHADHYSADIILNQNICTTGTRYSRRESYTQLLLGPRYALLRREFASQPDRVRKHPDIARNVLVTLGGADADNATLKVVRALREIDNGKIEAKVVLGPANPNRRMIEAELRAGHPPCQLLQATKNMPELMAWADMAVSAGGSTCWEMALMGLPMVILVLAKNQEAVAQQLQAQGAGVNMGWHREITVGGIASQLKELMTDRDKRCEMGHVGQALVDGKGSRRVVMSMVPDPLVLRPVREQDCEQLWKWANDPVVRKASFSTAPIPWEDHLRWFRSKYRDPSCLFFLSLDGSQTPVGQIRIERKDADAVISVSVDSGFRGCGCGSRMIELASRKFFEAAAGLSLHAYVRTENVISRQVFLKAGFKSRGATTLLGCSAIHLELRRNGE